MGTAPPLPPQAPAGQTWDGDVTAFVASLLFHLGILVALAYVPLLMPDSEHELLITSAVDEQLEPEPLQVPEEAAFSEQPADEIGANSVMDADAALSLAPIISAVSEIPSPVEALPTKDHRIEINQMVEMATGTHYAEHLTVKGAAGPGETGVMGAIDRITHEILLSLEERKTLVVWIFDRSGSLHRQRQAIHARLDRIYDELGVLEAAQNPAFDRHEDKPLLTSVVAFGNQVELLTEQPTDNIEEIKAAVSGIQLDDSGTERVFSAVFMAAQEYKDLRIPDRRTDQPERNVMLIVLTDEAGDDQSGLDETVRLCRRYEMPVYVIGVPAPFGRKETYVKWVDPDPSYDQTPRWGEVNQGPESLLPERVRLAFDGKVREEEVAIDSGFGPFALTRLSYETGGIYFAVHPNRNVNREVNGRETEAFAAHISYFFDPEVMRKYRPDYVSAPEYARRAAENKARSALLNAAQLSWVTPMQDPALRFVKTGEAELALALTEAQKQSAKLEPQVQRLYETLKFGEADREKEFSPRWQAGYDLAMGRVMAVMIRTESYNAMLAVAKRGLKFEDEKNNTWVLAPTDDINVGSNMEKLAEKARQYLQRVVEQHPGTPWAMLAEQELQQPLGWTWTEQFTDLSPPPARRPAAGNGGRPAPPRDDQKRSLPPPPPRRPVPKL